MVFKFFCILVLWMIVASTLEGLIVGLVSVLFGPHQTSSNVQPAAKPGRIPLHPCSFIYIYKALCEGTVVLC